jgi:signal transduction histidine kinase
MKRNLPYLLILICFLRASAQDASNLKLRQQVKDHTQADTFRVNRLNQLAKLNSSSEVSSVSLNERDGMAKEAYAIAKKINYPLGEAYALINLANVKDQSGEKEEAFSILKKAYQIGEKINDKELLVNVLFGMSKAKAQTSENKQALLYSLQAEAIAQKMADKKILAECQRNISSIYRNSLSDFPKATDWVLKSIKTGEDAHCLDCLAKSWTSMASLLTLMGDDAKGLVYYKKALDANRKLGNKSIQYTLLNNIGERYRLLGKYPQAIEAYKGALKGNTTPYTIELNESNLADVYVRMNNLPEAFKYGFSSLNLAKKIGDVEGMAWINGVLSRAYLKQGKPDSALYYAKQGLDQAKQTGTLEFMRDNSGALANAYAQIKDFAKAYEYQNLYVAYRDSMVNTQITNQAGLLQYNYDLAKKQAQIMALNQEKKMQYYFLIGSLIMLLLIGATGVILYRNNRQKHKANMLLVKQKHLIEEKSEQTNKALSELQHTQNQLIQAEKMASLGELTAGIAHEIQNPLNFVNNFSDVNMELVDEMHSELINGDKETAITISKDIKLNMEKIKHHGKRAEGIVKGMLQHSRVNGTTKELTDINKLNDEYLRLAYHGLRAKDKSFNAELITNFAKDLPEINIVPQDIGRVLLNMFNNAFYATQQKQKTAGANYKPTIEVMTKLVDVPLGGQRAVVSVKDNGIGIPKDIKEKIMQPFFTTKPTGEGTGLGLSISYDTVVKGHGGTINVETEAGEFSEFTVALPLS